MMELPNCFSPPNPTRKKSAKTAELMFLLSYHELCIVCLFKISIHAFIKGMDPKMQTS